MQYPADAASGVAVWCINAKHGQPGTLVCTGRHEQGRRWQARWVGDGQERSKSFAKKIDAENHVKQVTADVTTGNYVDTRRSATTFGTIAESWLKGKQAATRAPKTIAGYRGLLHVVILPKWEDEKLSDITHERLQDWLNWLATNPAARQHKRQGNEDTGLSPARVVQVHQVVHQVFAHVARSRYLASNAANEIVLPSKIPSKDLALTHDQVHRLAEESANAEADVRRRSDTVPPRLSPQGFAIMVRFMAYSGLRFGECV